MSFLSWLFTVAFIEECWPGILGVLVALPLCFANPFIGVLAGFVVWGIASYAKEKDDE